MTCLKLLCACVLLAPAAGEKSKPLAAGAKPNLLFQRLRWEQADYYCSQGQPVEAVEKKAFCKSDRPLLLDDPTATFPVPILFDESGGTSKGYDRLYVDFDGDGDFLNDPAYKAAKGSNVPPRAYAGSVVACFENVCLVSNRKHKRFAHVQIVLLSSPSEGSVRHTCAMIPQKWAVGKVTVGGKELPVALIDRNWNDRVTDAAGLNLKEHPQRFPRGDYLLLGIDGEEGLRLPDESGGAGSARGILTEYLVLNTGAYKVQTEQTEGGVKLELAPARLPMGKLNVVAVAGSRSYIGADCGACALVSTVEKAAPPLPDRLLLIGARTCVLLRNPAEVVTLPVDTYFAPHVNPEATFTVAVGRTAGPAPKTPQPELDDGLF